MWIYVYVLEIVNKMMMAMIDECVKIHKIA